MNIVLLSGGSGKRLWPLSNDVRSKQFIKIFRDGEGYESMVQRVYRQIRDVDPEAVVTIATSKSQVSAIHNQLGPEVGISVEPCRRDTFPAIALATAYLHEKMGIASDEAVVICPVDPYVEEGYFQCLQDMYEAARTGKENLVLMGIEPDGPSEKYGYIKPEAGGGFTFTEKPTEEKAREYIAAGALWNGGVFAYRLKYVMEKSRELLGTSEYQELYDHYAELKKISFDYAVVEQEKSIAVLRYRGVWKDIGTWNTLAETMEEPTVGNAVIGDRCENVHIVNELDIPVLAMGMKDTVIAASPDGILVASAETADRIKPYVDTISRQIMFAEKSWGNYLVIDAEDSSLTIKANLKPMQRMNYHSHERRDEVWTIISGFGKAVIDGEDTTVAPGDVIRMNAGQKHTIIAGEQGLQLIEVQLGKDISVSDKKKY
ncbi:MAG: cupin domain-containing protein [Clostridia bacterium]|nr:cupin domain-containing protein [Clostridia bacterium]